MTKRRNSKTSGPVLTIGSMKAGRPKAQPLGNACTGHWNTQRSSSTLTVKDSMQLLATHRFWAESRLARIFGEPYERFLKESSARIEAWAL